MRAVLGGVLLGIGGVWLVWMALRRERRVDPLQALMDFSTGAPIESVLSVALTLAGLVLLLAQVLAD
jgi:hypothetical protein